MRTKEQGLLTTADVMSITFKHQIPLRRMAHGGDELASSNCPHCATLGEALGNWIAGHAASLEELEELERSTETVTGDER